ncbi:MAG TPA: BACON domain-containing protein [Bacteroidales bacterium]|nr:BACON domain-containing protein [Bacteroidales bacterium]
MRRALLVHHGLNHERTPLIFLDVDPLTLNFPYTADSDTVEVDVATEDQAWDYSADMGHAPAWGYVSGASKLGDDTVTIGVYENTTGSPRQGTVTFTSDDCDDVVVTINQMANPI